MIKENYSDRVYVLKELITDNLDHTVNEVLFEGLLDRFYNEFVDFCEYVKINEDLIDNISCFIEGDEIEFDISYK